MDESRKTEQPNFSKIEGKIIKVIHSEVPAPFSR